MPFATFFNPYITITVSTTCNNTVGGWCPVNSSNCLMVLEKNPSWISKLENIANQTTPNCSQKIIVFIPYAIDFNNLPEIVLSHLSITVLASFGTTVILLMFLCSTFSVYRFSFQDFSFIHHWYHPQRIPWGCDW